MMNQISISGATLPESEPSNVIRRIRWYEKLGDRLIGEATLHSISLTELQTWFSESVDNPMYNCYPISESQARCFRQKLKEPLELDQYSYYLECDAVAEPAYRSSLSTPQVKPLTLTNRADF